MNDNHLHFANIQAEHQAGRLAEAKAAYLEYIQQHPDSATAYNNLGTIYFAQNEFDAAVSAFQSAIRIKAEYTDAYYNLGLALNRLTRYQEALHAYEALIAIMPDHLAAHFQLACLFMRLAKYHEALAHFLLIDAKQSHHVETKINLATCYLQLKEYSAAKAQYLQALELSPTDTQVLFNLGIISTQQGRGKEAVNFYQQALNIEPNFFDAHNNLAIIYLTLQDRDSAIRHFQEALRIQSGDIAIRHTLHILSQNTDLSSSPPEYIRALFDSYAARYDVHLTQTLHYQVPQNMYATFQTLGLEKIKHYHILDLGCGTGLCGEYFKSNAKTLTGVDLSQKMLAIAQQKELYDQLIEAELLLYLDADKNQYDLILAADVLIYFGDLAMLLTEIKQHLTPGGIFIFNTEKHHTQDYIMTNSGRFAHCSSYIHRLCAQNHFEILSCTETTLRTQAGVVVLGDLYFLRRP